MLTKEMKSEIVSKFGSNEKDTGKTEVQIALLTKRIQLLTGHFEKQKKDFHSKRGLMQLVGKRKSFLKHLNEISPERYQNVIKELGLRK